MREKSVYLADIMEGQIRDSKWGTSGRLPSVRKLNAALNASAPAILKTLALLVQRGIIEKLPGGEGYCLSGFAPELPGLSNSTRSRPEQIAEELSRDIQCGIPISSDGFPTAHQLQLRFGCGHRSIKKALELLTLRGLIVRFGKTYRLPDNVYIPTHQKHIYLCGTSNALQYGDTGVYVFIHSLERAILAMGWPPLKIFILKNLSSNDHSEKLPEAAAYIVIKYRYPGGWKKKFLEKKSTPVIIVEPDENYGWNNSFQASHRQFLHLCPDNAYAGREMARVLYRNGHRHIAIFSHLASEQKIRCWDKLRVTGLCETFNRITPGKQSGGSWEDASAQIFGPDTVSKQLNFEGRAEKRFGKILQSILKEFPFLSSLASEFHGSIHSIQSYITIGTSMFDFFEQALTDTKITAWVCINDELAILAKAYLTFKGKKIPDDISLASFDNSPASYRYGISSYHFSYEKMGNLSVQFIGKPQTIRSGKQGDFPIRGTFVVRNSLGTIQVAGKKLKSQDT